MNLTLQIVLNVLQQFISYFCPVCKIFPALYYRIDFRNYFFTFFYVNEQKSDKINNSSILSSQKYLKNKGGYFHWHSEHYPHPVDPHQDSLHRTLLWMVYLNDVEEGGETSIPRYNIKCKPKAGRLLMFPPYWTHPHQGEKVIKGTKYILMT